MKYFIKYITIFLVLIWFFNGYISYFQFQSVLPRDLFSYPYKYLTATEVNMWKFGLRWVIPGIIVLTFMYFSKFPERVSTNWGLYLVGVIAFIFLTRIFVLYLSTLVQGGGATYAVSYLSSYLSIPTSIGLLVGTLKIFISLKPLNSVK